MEELEEQLVRTPQGTQNTAALPESLPQRATSPPAGEVDELTTLQPEMAL